MRKLWWTAVLAATMAAPTVAVSAPQGAPPSPSTAGARNAGSGSSSRSPAPMSDTKAQQLAAQAKQEFVHAWSHQAAPPFVVKTVDKKSSITIDTSAAPELKVWAQMNLAPVLALWYPRIDALLASDGFVAPTRVAITFKPEPGVAETQGSEVSGNSEWFRAHLGDEAVGAMVHELVHVAQQYGDREPESFPGWLTEGIADYIRFFKFEPDHHGADDVWLKKQNFAKVRFDGAYRQTANFLDWVTRKYDPQIVAKLNASARRGVYCEDIWQAKSGKTSVELGNEWKEEKAQLMNSLGTADAN